MEKTAMADLSEDGKFRLGRNKRSNHRMLEVGMSGIKEK